MEHKLLLLLFILVTCSSAASARIVESRIVDFPVNGRVIVQAREEIGQFPRMVFISKRTGVVLLTSPIEDPDNWLIPQKDSELAQPILRFRPIHSAGFNGPMIMSVAVRFGGSDNGYYLNAFAEVRGKVRRVTTTPLVMNNLGGFYLGYLNKKFGYGLAVWDFIWASGPDIGEAHYGIHKYNIRIFRMSGGQFKPVLHKVSRKRYNGDHCSMALREIGIRAHDQRREIPRIRRALY